jgi:hypothetical protein
MNSIQTEPKPDSLSILAKGEMFTARKLDGTTEEVKIRDLPVSEIPKLLAAYGNEAELVELYCSKEKGWADVIDREDTVKIAEIGDRRNLSFFGKYLARQTARLEVLMPGAGNELKNKMGSLLGTGSPQSR